MTELPVPVPIANGMCDPVDAHLLQFVFSQFATIIAQGKVGRCMRAFDPHDSSVVRAGCVSFVVEQPKVNMFVTCNAYASLESPCTVSFQSGSGVRR